MESKNCRIESFQSTLPARGATHIEAAKNMQIKYFNPRSPRGERRFPALVQASLDCISIHAPREGSDSVERPALADQLDFNPRSPRGERLNVIDKIRVEQVISIHAPREGSDNTPKCREAQIYISIHAPREGSDHFFSRLFNEMSYFNPRSPRGERRTCLHARYLHGSISIHAPREGSDDISAGNKTATEIFQSTLPARGATIASMKSLWEEHEFQSTLPARGATGFRSTLTAEQRISIHAPREGSDCGLEVTKDEPVYFNPRSPRGERR